MSPEKFHDALNYLDDDLIAQTDELRQGKRVLQHRPNVRQVIPWVAAAACLTLAVGIGSRLLPSVGTESLANTGSDQMYQDAGKSPGVLQDDASAVKENSNRAESQTCIWVPRRIGYISLEVPIDWSCEQVTDTDGSYYLLLTPPNEKGAIRIGYDPRFGVCGTGLTTEETVIAGMDACVGTYDGDNMWCFITFAGKGEGYVAVNESLGWWGVYGDTAMDILETLVIE